MRRHTVVDRYLASEKTRARLEKTRKLLPFSRRILSDFGLTEHEDDRNEKSMFTNADRPSLSHSLKCDRRALLPTFAFSFNTNFEAPHTNISANSQSFCFEWERMRNHRTKLSAFPSVLILICRLSSFPFILTICSRLFSLTGLRVRANRHDF